MGRSRKNSRGGHLIIKTGKGVLSKSLDSLDSLDSLENKFRIGPSHPPCVEGVFGPRYRKVAGPAFL